MSKIQFVEARGPKVFNERLWKIAKELGVVILFEKNHRPDLMLEYTSKNPGDEVYIV